MRCHITLLATILLALSLPVATINAGDPPPPEEIRLSSPCHDAMLSACQAGEVENATICEMLRGTRNEDSTSLLDFLNNVMELPGHDDLICARLFGTKVFANLLYGNSYWLEGTPDPPSLITLSTHESRSRTNPSVDSSAQTRREPKPLERKIYTYTAPDGTLTFSDTPPDGSASDLEEYKPSSVREEPQRIPEVPQLLAPKRDIVLHVSFICRDTDEILVRDMKDIRDDFYRFVEGRIDPSVIANLNLTVEGTVKTIQWVWLCNDPQCRIYPKPHGPHYPSYNARSNGVTITLNPCRVISATSTISHGTSLQDHVTGLKRIMGEWFRYHMGEGPRPTFPPQSEK